MEGHVMKRAPHILHDLILAAATVTGLTVTAAVVFGSATLSANDAQTDVANARGAMAVATGSRVGVGGINMPGVSDTGGSAGRPHERGSTPAALTRTDRQRAGTVTAKGGAL